MLKTEHSIQVDLKQKTLHKHASREGSLLGKITSTWVDKNAGLVLEALLQASTRNRTEYVTKEQSWREADSCAVPKEAKEKAPLGA